MAPSSSAHDTSSYERERWVTEATSTGLPRSDFERDRARVLHSSALRRLAAKTQVVGVGEDDFPRTRLTHSLEVAQIGRSLALALGCDADLVDAACLAHDLGHPPFGHTGEQALDRCAADCGGFEGNAQTFRILTRLEAKVLRPDGSSAGLNLTRATLDATLKYPWPREAAPPTSAIPKFGFYEQDRVAYEWVRGTSGSRERRLEAQVMDWADDIAYSVHDVEDAIHAGNLSIDVLRTDAAERYALCALAASMYSPEDEAYLTDALAGLLDLPAVRDLPAHDGTLPAQVALKRLTSNLISRFIRVAVEQTIPEGPGERPHHLVVPRLERAWCALLKAMAARYVMMRADSRSRRQWQTDLVTDLVEGLWAAAPGGLATALAVDWKAAADDADRRRVVIDAVASMTDTSALSAHAALRARTPGR